MTTVIKTLNRLNEFTRATGRSTCLQLTAGATVCQREKLNH